jgi:hypothetical protein
LRSIPTVFAERESCNLERNAAGRGSGPIEVCPAANLCGLGGSAQGGIGGHDTVLLYGEYLACYPKQGESWFDSSNPLLIW